MDHKVDLSPSFVESSGKVDIPSSGFYKMIQAVPKVRSSLLMELVTLPFITPDWARIDVVLMRERRRVVSRFIPS